MAQKVLDNYRAGEVAAKSERAGKLYPVSDSIGRHAELILAIVGRQRISKENSKWCWTPIMDRAAALAVHCLSNSPVG